VQMSFCLRWELAAEINCVFSVHSVELSVMSITRWSFSHSRSVTQRIEVSDGTY
jgi:hypothetical protein